MSNTAIQSLFNGNGATVRAWLLTGLAWQGQNIITGDLQVQNPNFTNQPGRCNHINGYNLTIDQDKFMEWYALYRRSDGNLDEQTTSSGAIPLKFVTPLMDNQYKVFVQMKTTLMYSPTATFTHCLNSATYPKTKNGFWIRWGFLASQADVNFYTNPSIPSQYVNRRGRDASPAIPLQAGKIKNQTLTAFNYQLQVLVV